MNAILETIASEFQDVSVTQATQLSVRLAMAALLGGLLGWERELVKRAAGFRTHILVAVGSAAFVAIPMQLGMSPSDLSRIFQGLLAGIGFLGAGSILKREDKGEIHGLTTAAGLWLTAGVGAAAGLGRETSAIIIAFVAWLTLSMLRRFEPNPGGAKMN